VTETLPASWYRDPEIFERERQRIFRREWQVLGAEPEVCRKADVAGWPVLVVRQPDGSLRAFHDVCRHRASPLECVGGVIQCPYHGWTYGSDGALKRARDFGEEVDGLDLHPVAVAAWRGLVWVNLDPDATFDLGSFAAECADFDMESFRVVGESSHVLRCNWKTYADNYGEGYHIPFVHPELNRQLDMRSYRVDAFDRWTRHSAAMHDGSPAAGVWLWRFPNLALNVYPDGMNVERFTPLDAGTTRIDYTFWFRDGVADEEAMKLSNDLLLEDAAICEAVQRNLDTGIYDTGVLSPKHEGGLALFHRLVRDALSIPPRTAPAETIGSKRGESP
jgi:choline monooxygenase